MWQIVADTTELAELWRDVSEGTSLAIGVDVERRALPRLCEALRAGTSIAWLCDQWPDEEALAKIASARGEARDSAPQCLLCLPTETETLTAALALDLGLPCFSEPEELAVALILGSAGISDPWSADLSALRPLDRHRLAPRSVLTARTKNAYPYALVPSGPNARGIAIEGQGQAPLHLGHPRDVAIALRQLRAVSHRSQQPIIAADEAEAGNRQAVFDVVFGPSRPLSDPASKAALAPYGIPFPEEELCASPSRAASEAARMGFPVRIALASPDLRIWDHPDLAIDGVDNGARVRDVFRQVMAMARDRAPSARLLGVTVSASEPSLAILRAELRPLGVGRAALELGFADAHGVAADDRTLTVGPLSSADLQRALARLRGADLLLGGTPSDRRQVVDALHDVLMRMTRFTVHFAKEIESVRIDPMALLLSGRVEVQEVCVTVSDAFERSLERVGNE